MNQLSFNQNLLLAFVLALIKLNNSTPIKTNCTSVDSSDGSVGVDCVRSSQPNDAFDPTAIEQDFKKNNSMEGPVAIPMNDLFIQNLAVMDQANMSDCIARANCEEKCDLATRGIFQENPEEEALEGEEDLPDFVKNFYEAGRRGLELAQSGECGNCEAMYTECDKIQYDYTVKTNALYRDLIKRNITLFERNESEEQKIPVEIEYLHHSMKFLDLANLTGCYARVSCETTCNHVKAAPNSEAPPQTSPFLQDDPQKPESVDIIHNGAILGFNLAHKGLCDECADYYTDCTPDMYTIAHSSSIIFG